MQDFKQLLSAPLLPAIVVNVTCECITSCHLGNDSVVGFVTAHHFRNSSYEGMTTPCLSCIVTPGHLGNGSCLLFSTPSYLGNQLM